MVKFYSQEEITFKARHASLILTIVFICTQVRHQMCTNPWPHITWATNICTVAPIICGT